MCLPAMDEFLSRVKRFYLTYINFYTVCMCRCALNGIIARPFLVHWNLCVSPLSTILLLKITTDSFGVILSVCLFVCMRFGHWVCGESWHGSLTHRPSSQGWAPGVSSKSNAILSVIILKRGLIISMEWTN